MDAKKQADSLEKVTDRHEERELDDAKMLQAFQSLDRSSIIQEQEKKRGIVQGCNQGGGRYFYC